MAMKREAAIVPYSPNLYSVRYRQRGWFRWGKWKAVIFCNRTSGWSYKEAQSIYNQVLENGVVQSTEDPLWVLPIFELDEEKAV
jgi:hypothetical protein